MSSSTEKKPRVKFKGADGNAFNLLGICGHAAKLAGWPEERVAAFMEEAMSGDYRNLLRTCGKHFDVR